MPAESTNHTNSLPLFFIILTSCAFSEYSKNEMEIIVQFNLSFWPSTKITASMQQFQFVKIFLYVTHCLSPIAWRMAFNFLVLPAIQVLRPSPAATPSVLHLQNAEWKRTVASPAIAASRCAFCAAALPCCIPGILSSFCIPAARRPPLVLGLPPSPHGSSRHELRPPFAASGPSSDPSWRGRCRAPWRPPPPPPQEACHSKAPPRRLS